MLYLYVILVWLAANVLLLPLLILGELIADGLDRLSEPEGHRSR